ncbi:MAG: HYR domain-containing protein [Alphaproteobacteria bacterium]|nr:HYR domain-containing protein [Alphaproteobacteria bacterium]
MAPVYVLAAAAISAALLAGAESFALEIQPPPDITKEAEGVLTRVDVGTPVTAAHTVVSSAPGFFPLGETRVVWLARDGGERAVAIQTVTIRDTTPPEFVDIPTYIEFVTNSSKGIRPNFELPEAVDLVDLDVEVKSSHKPGARFPIGSTNVTFTATDDSGNIREKEVVIVVADTAARIRNLEAVAGTYTIQASWDRLEGHGTYKAVLAEEISGERVSVLTTSTTAAAFAGLKPETAYTVTVFATGDRSTKASIDVTTVRAPFLLVDDFSDTTLWTFQRILRTFEIADAYNHYHLTTDQTQGRPAPSGKISGYGYGSYAQIYRDFDISGLGGRDLYLGLDWRTVSDSPSYHENNLYVEIQIKGASVYREILLQGGTTDTGWRSLSDDITDAVGDAATIRVYMYSHDYKRADTNREIHLDNLYLGSSPPG